MWTVEKAKQFCKNPEWVHLNTTPLNTLWRLSGLAIGMTKYHELTDVQAVPGTLPKRGIFATLAVIFNLFILPAIQDNVYQSSGESLFIFYACSSFHFMFIPICLMFFSKFV